MRTARIYLSWYGNGRYNDSYLQWVRLVVERVRAMLEDETGRNAAPGATETGNSRPA